MNDEPKKRFRLRTVAVRVLVALALLGFAAAARAITDHFLPPPRELSLPMLACTACFFLPPFIAVGVLFGRAFWGAVVGFGCYVTLFGWMIWAFHEPPR